MNFSVFQCTMNMLTDYCQWQDYVTADHLNMLRMLQAKVADPAPPKLKQGSSGLPVEPKPFLKSLFFIRIVLWLCIAVCMYPEDTLAACLVILVQFGSR